MPADTFIDLLLYQLSMSLLSVGGVITLASEQHRHMVVEQGWLSDAQFQASITLAQAAPGPNVLFLALWGWHVGLNAAAGVDPAAAGLLGAWLPWAGASLGLIVCMAGALGPSSVLVVMVNRWSRRHAQRHFVQALRQGLAPIVVGAMGATAVVLVKATTAGAGAGAGTGAPDGPTATAALPWLIAALSALLVWRTRVHLLVLLSLGAAVGLMWNRSP